MTRRRSPLLTIFSLLLVVSLCVVIVIIVSIPVLLSQRATQVFGPPDPDLNTIDLIYLSTLLIINEDKLTNPNNIHGTPMPFSVLLGESATSIAQRLYSDGLIAYPSHFLTYLEYSGLDTTIQAGEYKLTPALSPVAIALALQDATPTHVTFRILPGWRMEEIAAALPTSGLDITSEEFLAAASQPMNSYYISSILSPQGTLEGLFFPDTYELPRELKLDEFILTILENFDSNLDPEILQGLNLQGLDAYEGIILASLVERESVDSDEMPIIASVFHNRLAAGMKLDSDPTVQYALGFQQDQKTWWKNPLSLEDLNVDSPYNTYLYKTLPPGPIANPSLVALKAVAFPTRTTYYYFRAACDGSGRHVFAETFESHVENACQ